MKKNYVFGCVLAVCLLACSEDVTLEVNTEDKTGYESLTDEEEHAYAGCVPVAISQILSFHKYPVKFGNTIVNWLEITRYPSVDLLREHGYLARGESFTSAVLPYVGGHYEMRFILPDEGATADEVADALASAGVLQAAIDNGEECRINYAVPRFEMENDITLNGALQALGMKLAFTDEGDLSALTTPYAPVSTIFQVATLKVDEEGSEGAAVTSVTDGAPLPDGVRKEIDFTLDRPFLFLLTETGTGTVLFMGKVEKPK